MDPDFWQNRWAVGSIGFHEGKPNSYLVRHHDKLATFPRVFVPMCGKSEDLAFLATQGHEVIGVELVEDAVKAFFEEHQLSTRVIKRDSFVQYTSGSITIYAGDLFATSRAQLGGIDAIWDRAALVALPDDTRRRYVDHLRALLPRGGRVLLVTLEYDTTQMEGPPFSVEEPEVRALYDRCEIEVLTSGPDPRGRANGIERSFSITV